MKLRLVFVKLGLIRGFVLITRRLWDAKALSLPHSTPMNARPYVYLITRISCILRCPYVHQREATKRERSVPGRPPRSISEPLSFVISVNLFSELHRVTVRFLHCLSIGRFARFHQFRLIHAFIYS